MAELLVDEHDPGGFNQALMELGVYVYVNECSRRMAAFVCVVNEHDPGGFNQALMKLGG